MAIPTPVSTPETCCPSCNTAFTGHFCHVCGEKKLHVRHDFSIKEFLEDTIDRFTHFDSRIIRSFKYLFFRPGQLTQNYCTGQRVKFMRPVQIFIIASVLFYFFMPKSSSFYSSYEELQMGYHHQGFSLNNPFHYDINQKLRSKAVLINADSTNKAEINKTATAIYNKAETKAANLSKLLLFSILPFWAMILYLFFYKQQSYFVPHIIFVLHCFSFFLLTDMVFLFFYFDLIGLRVIESGLHMLPFFILFFIYLVLAIKKVYSQSLLNAIWKAVLVNLVLFALLILYRNMITILAVSTV